MIGMISCKEATYLTSKKEQGKISIVERMKLSFHFMMCKFCKMFAVQNDIIVHHAKRMEEVLSATDTSMLPDTVKEHIKNSMK